jgi:hypothetical protein
MRVQARDAQFLAQVTNPKVFVIALSLQELVMEAAKRERVGD